MQKPDIIGFKMLRETLVKLIGLGFYLVIIRFNTNGIKGSFLRQALQEFIAPQRQICLAITTALTMPLTVSMSIDLISWT